MNRRTFQKVLASWLVAGLWIVSSTTISGQNCSATLCGTVREAKSGKPVAFAEVFIHETQAGAVTNADGRFHIHGLCEGKYTVDVRHIGCHTVSKVVDIVGNMEVDFELHHSALNLDEVVVKASAVAPLAMQAETRIGGLQLIASQGQTLSDALEDLPGVSVLNTGQTISKPVIQGLHSNRILILNNGVRQEGQQWGLDHAPEIDPYTAGEITVVKGASSVRYGQDAIGGVILLTPKPIREAPGTSGELNLAGFSNGRTGVASAFVESLWQTKRSAHQLWSRIQGTLKRGGNYHTPAYFLENTGLKETNGSATIGAKRGNFLAEVFYSYFFTEIGIFRGAHIGNLTDLQLAIDRGRPIQDGSFSYHLGRPAQKVAHHLLKTKAEWKSDQLGTFSLVYARQFNRRQEFDAHSLGGPSQEALQVPSLEFEITTHTADVVLKHRPLLRYFTGSVGLQLMHQVNTTDRGGLIPNYDSQSGGLFWIERWRNYPFPLEIELGIRYDVKRLYADRRGPDRIDEERIFRNFSGTVGGLYRISDAIHARLHFGTAWRAPTVNELYSDGVHHGAASYELGQKDLSAEKAFLTSFTFEASLPVQNGRSAQATLSIYRNRIREFIYLAPMPQPVLTIRGAFPAFRYEQTNAMLSGMDFDFNWPLTTPLTFDGGLSVLRARNLTTKDWLIFMPADRLWGGLEYAFLTSVKEAAGQVDDRRASLKIDVVHVLEQKRVPPGFDYAPPPKAYTLFNLEARLKWNWQDLPAFLTLGIENIFNHTYRDYLNRLRYFTEEQGRNFSVRFNLKF
ncbi:MAG: TonB-dependent receptor [Saprospirales bacterium]|nr:TonB-dependent receptor [Saprospirales bacterium]